MQGPICIITPTGMICESVSYEHHYPFDPGEMPGAPKKKPCKKTQDQIPPVLEARVGMLIGLAKQGGMKDTDNFVIMTKPMP